MCGKMMRLLAAAGCASMLATTAYGQARTARFEGRGISSFSVPVTPDKNESFRAERLILPAALIAVGAVGIYSDGFRSLNRKVRDGMGHLRGESRYFHADDYMQYLPLLAHIGLGSVGVKARHNFKERFVIDATAYLSMGILVNATKYAVGERRPDSRACNSFPSGHTATAFMGAELARMEYGTGTGIGAYVVATGVAFLRLYNNRHWLNDVIAGAGIGILSARIGYWMLPVYRRWFGWDIPQNTTQIAFMPGYDASSHTMQIGIALRF